MPEEVIQLREQERRADVALAPEEAVALARSPARVEVRPTTSPGRYDLRPSCVVGTFALPTRTVVIRPKVDVGRLLWMLDVVGRVPDFGPEVHLDEEADFLRALRAQYARLLARALRLGPVREYVGVEEDVPTVRGAPDLLGLATRRLGIPVPIPCRFEELSVDTEVNRQLLAAARLLSRWRRDDVGSRLDALAALLEGVREVRYRPDDVPEPRLDRRHTHVIPALRLAQLVLRRATVELREGRVLGLGFLLDMNELYEAFVVEALRRVLGLAPARLVRHPRGLRLDGAGAYRLVPDALWLERDGSPLAVLDAKYKRADAADRADVYQITTYMAALGIERGILVHADVPTRTHVLVHGPRVLAVRLGLEGTPEEVAAHVADVAGRIVAFLGVASPSPRPQSLLAGGSTELLREATA